jgi:putative two-component system response regulator
MGVSDPIQEESTGNGTGSARCLVVDDDPLVRHTLARILQAQGMAPVEVESAREALDLLQRHGAVPLVIADIYMPEMDGIELLREIRQRWPDTGVMMITGVAEVGTAVECLQAGALDYLAKPVQLEEVRARIHNALERHRLALENRYLQQSYQERLEAQLRELARRNKEMFLGQIQMAVHMLEKKDVYTRGHSRRVAVYAVKTAIQMGFTGEVLDQIRLGGELHDIGKIGTRDDVLNKPGPLTPGEFEEIKKHVVEGEEILEPLRREHPMVLDIVRSHHERLDGSGFPDRLMGDAIPLVARVVSVADAFDAMTTSRAYRPSRTATEAMNELQRCSGRHFDPVIVAAFLRAFPDVARLPLTTVQ